MSNSDAINQKVGLLTQADFENLPEKEHVLRRPGMWIGSTKRNPYDVRVATFPTDEEGNIVPISTKMEIDTPSGMERTFLEILSNTGDNAQQTRLTEGYENLEQYVNVFIDNTTVSINNGGLPIPVMKHCTGEWLPQFIFNNLRTSSHFKDEVVRISCGLNGLGAKLTNIFSKMFRVEIYDGIRQLHYVQEWRDNMEIMSDPFVEHYYGPRSMSVISYQLDFPRFDSIQYKPTDVQLYAMHTASTSFIHKIPTTFNGIPLNMIDHGAYPKFLFGEKIASTAIYHNEWPTGTPTKKINGVLVAQDPTARPTVELIVMDTPDAGTHVSFVNGIPTRDGGVHVKEAYSKVGSYVLDLMNSRLKKGQSTSRLSSLTVSDVRRHITIILNVLVPNPDFTGQTKGYFSEPKVIITVPDNFKKKLLDWQLMDRLKAAVNAKYYKAAKATDGKKTKHLFNVKVHDCNWAGTKRSSQCSLMITEGDSASGYARKWITYDKTQNTVGIFGLGGKPLNALKAKKHNRMKLLEDKVICRLKEVLGLVEGTDYSIDKNYEKLRYGRIWILADADVDGDHIKGLVLLYFQQMFPALLARGVVYFVRTPIIRVNKGEMTKAFYTDSEYEEWRDSTLGYKKWEHSYYKGLGTSSDDQIQDDIKAPVVVECIYDDKTDETMNLAFGTGNMEERKRWVALEQTQLNVVEFRRMPISQVINYEIWKYSNSNNDRSIPHFLDGLKPGQRKALWTARFKTKGWGTNAIKNGTGKNKKMTIVGGVVTAETSYHHGETSLYNSMINMTQCYPGSNNLPFFKNVAQYGTRTENGKDAASPRYLNMNPASWLPWVFRDDDVPLFNFLEDEGESIEPEYLLPIIPMHLVNGCDGIGSAWRTWVPNHNPVQICQWILNRLTGQPVFPLIPYYVGFTGDITYEETGERAPVRRTNIIDPLDDGYKDLEDKNFNKEDLETPGTEEVMMEEGTIIPYVLRMEGKFHEENGKIVITEIPLGISIGRYCRWLKKLVETGVIKDFENMSTFDSPKFILKGLSDPSINRLRLSRKFGMGSLVLMSNGRPVRFDTTDQIMETFFQTRLPFYYKRKELLLASLAQKILRLSERIRFIRLVVDDKIIVSKRSKDNVIGQMAQFNISEEALTKTKLEHCTLDELQKLEGKRNEAQASHDEITKIIPEQIWIDEIVEFMNIYSNHNKAALAKK